jgi:hypothetical protein
MQGWVDTLVSYRVLLHVAMVCPHTLALHGHRWGGLRTTCNICFCTVLVRASPHDCVTCPAAVLHCPRDTQHSRLLHIHPLSLNGVSHDMSTLDLDQTNSLPCPEGQPRNWPSIGLLLHNLGTRTLRICQGKTTEGGHMPALVVHAHEIMPHTCNFTHSWTAMHAVQETKPSRYGMADPECRCQSYQTQVPHMTSIESVQGTCLAVPKHLLKGFDWSWEHRFTVQGSRFQILTNACEESPHLLIQEMQRPTQCWGV